MAKRSKRGFKPYIEWNALTVRDIQKIILHFHEQEVYYSQKVAEARFRNERSVFESSIPIMQSRQKFWVEMLDHVMQEEKISTHVRDYINYQRQNGDF